MSGITALTVLTADGNTAIDTHRGGEGTLAAWGTWAGGTAKLQATFDAGTTWIDVASISLTANGIKSFTVGPCKLRGNLAGSATPTLSIMVYV